MAASINGRIASFPQETDEARKKSGFIVEADEQLLRDELMNADAIITGANSLRVTRTVFENVNARGKIPTWFILTKSGLARDLEFWDQRDVCKIIASINDPFTERKSIPENSHWLKLNENAPAKTIFDDLKRRGFERVLLFGGGAINKIFYEENLVNELKLTTAPFVFGNISAPSLVDPGFGPSRNLSLLSSHAIGSHVFLNYRVNQ
jgi:riboflavin biosynthesis pyrimidine reductase